MSMTISIDDDLKREFSSVCKEMGMNASTAFAIYAKAVVRERRIPFDVTADSQDTHMQRVYEAGVNEGLWEGYRDFQEGDYLTREEFERLRGQMEGAA